MMRRRIDFGMTAGILILALARPAAAAEADDLDPACLQKLAAAGPVTAFDDAIKALPEIEPKSTYESTADYEHRLTIATGQHPDPILLKRTPSRVSEGLSYDPNRRALTIYPAAFGAGSINFSTIFGIGSRGLDAFASAIAFNLEATEVGKEDHEATNGFGARVMVTRTTRRVHALWERHGRNGESQFAGKSAFRPLAVIAMAPDAARDVIEHGSIAFLVAPKPPFRGAGIDGVAPDYRHPRERIDQVTAIIADVQCAYVRASDGTAMAAFAVR